MRSEKSKKGSKNNKAKRNVQTVGKAPGRQSKEEIIRVLRQIWWYFFYCE